MYNTQIFQDWYIEIGGKTNSSGFWRVSKPGSQCLLSICLTMIVRAMRLLTTVSM
jgi:hypothetical protein